jgi:hypothetical protein
MNDVYLRFRGKGFSGHGVEKHLARIDHESNDVWLYDPISSFFTKCHSLSVNARKRLIKAAKIARVNEIKLAFSPDGYYTPEEIISGWKMI